MPCEGGRHRLRKSGGKGTKKPLIPQGNPTQGVRPSPRPLPLLSSFPFPLARISFRFRTPFLTQKRDLPPISASPSPIKATFDGAENFPVSAPAFPAGLQGVKFPYIRKFISVYKKKYFRICRNLFPCGRKFISVRTKFLRSAEGEKSTFEGREIFFRAHKNLPLCPKRSFAWGKAGR